MVLTNFQNIGGNLAIAASIAFLRIASLVHGFEPYAALRNEFGFEGAKPVVTPMINVINGGKHASSGLAIQEIMIVPVIGDSSTEKIMIGAEIFSALKKVMIEATLFYLGRG
jgi:enolase